MAINLAGFLYSDNGTAIQSASITLIDSGGNTEATTTNIINPIINFCLFIQ